MAIGSSECVDNVNIYSHVDDVNRVGHVEIWTTGPARIIMEAFA
jgi:hypothetical protein